MFSQLTITNIQQQMSTSTVKNRSTKGGTKLNLKDRKYGMQVTKLRAGQKVTVSNAKIRRGVYDTLRSLNIETNFRTRKIAGGKFEISKRYSK